MAAQTLVQRIGDVVSRISAEIRAVRTLVNSNRPDLSNLLTTNKTSLVDALNELLGYVNTPGGLIDDTATASNNKTYSVNKIVALVNGALAALTNGAPQALNQLNELADALGNDANFASTVAISLSNRVRVDTPNQNLSPTQKQNARINIGADITTAEIGNPDTNFVNLFNSGLL
jgi:hypothetical protein